MSETHPDTITDIDGNKYAVLRIGDQLWMQQNLRVSKFRNGDPIPTGLSNVDWANTTGAAYAIYEDDPEILENYGKLYNWFTTTDPRGLCPEGWEVPGWDDVDRMVKYLMTEYGWTNDHTDVEAVGNQLKSCRQLGSPLGGGCNTSVHPRWEAHDTHYGRDGIGFNGLPASYRSSSSTLNPYWGLGTMGAFWTSTPSGPDNRMAFALSLVGLSGQASYEGVSNSNLGYSIRCIKGEKTFSVTFEVDMTYATAEYVGFEFHPGQDDVYIVGNLFGSWIEPGEDANNPPMTRVDEHSMVYSKTLQLPEGTYNYKYIVNKGWSTPEWGNEAHREIQVSNDNITVRDWFGSRTDPTGMLQKNIPFEFEVYPNPASSLIHIESTLMIREVKLFDLLGQQLMSEAVNDVHHSLNLSEIKPGLYVLQVVTGLGIKTQRVHLSR